MPCTINSWAPPAVNTAPIKMVSIEMNMSCLLVYGSFCGVFRAFIRNQSFDRRSSVLVVAWNEPGRRFRKIAHGDIADGMDDAQRRLFGGCGAALIRAFLAQIDEHKPQDRDYGHELADQAHLG